MAKPQVIEDFQIRHAIKVAAVSGQSKERDVALLMAAYGTGLMPNETAKLTLSDFLTASGAPRIESLLRAEIAFNGKQRPLIWASKKVQGAIDQYLAYRLAQGHGITTSKAAHRGLDPHGRSF
ncbi:hypothetical protein [Paraburkholderia sp. UYCP14C]|uniref:hypothetical protein n=1 Tax=Paraburkholderia sp. UYCP14C TaxID=2511130 RepID=UPI00200708B2|nr:hypothetical protein [Paraburkholderia sp. UYCP14C]